MADDEDDVEVVRDYRREDSRGRLVRVKVLRVPESEKFPEGIKYRLHYGTRDGETILRYDNSHGFHERHDGDETALIDFPGIATLYRRFRRRITTTDDDH
jgi:hypothetical protein